jgi:KDO2-lipid IV(A) lauroyltransferase
MRRLIGSLCKAVSWLISQLPVPVRLAIGDAIGVLWFDILRIRRKTAIDNVGIAFPEMPLGERTVLARSSLRHMGRSIVEYALFPFINSGNLERFFVLEGKEFIDEALKAGRGVLILTLHVGNGDLAVSALSRWGYRMNLISKVFKTRWLNELWFGMRRKHGTEFIAPEKSSFEILRALKRNESVVFVLDQFMGPPVGVRTKFFGRETGTAAGLALFYERTKAPVVPCVTYRRPDGRHVVRFEAPVSVQGLDDRPRDENIRALTQAYTDKLEEIVRRHPDQWMWIHRRWKEFRE